MNRTALFILLFGLILFAGCVSTTPLQTEPQSTSCEGIVKMPFMEETRGQPHVYLEEGVNRAGGWGENITTPRCEGGNEVGQNEKNLYCTEGYAIPIQKIEKDSEGNILSKTCYRLSGIEFRYVSERNITDNEGGLYPIPNVRLVTYELEDITCTPTPCCKWVMNNKGEWFCP